ncbi:lichenicidin A2 family type 2 lantibiotic [Rossellomorea vietnamensis]|uniref:Type 2 lantibiotic n=1 Tax=Rossellomorea aquimaris TaxID=189382 RepID=A0A5D4TNY7_9BACI|nr:mersacidin family lantibiotic [Rossellomorea aquimaris]TYS75756.1 type 2 lantibiotic [Rossellomorea aquimaris]
MMNEQAVGKSLKSLSKEEMEHIYGAAGEANPNTWPIVISAVRTSSKKCATTISAISGLVSYNKDCLG